MKSVLALAVTAGALWIATLTPGMAQADPYRWCAELGLGDDGGSTNCYFMTRAQCEATVSGNGGFCRLNHFYTGPKPADETTGAAPRRSDSKKRAPR